MNFNHSQHPAELPAKPWTVATAGLTLTWAIALPVIAAIAAPTVSPTVSPTDSPTTNATPTLEQPLSKSSPRWCRFIPRPYRIYVPDCR